MNIKYKLQNLKEKKKKKLLKINTKGKKGKRGKKNNHVCKLFSSSRFTMITRCLIIPIMFKVVVFDEK